jgi:hypothetical protein
MMETALVLTVPEAEPHVQRCRTMHDPVALRGMPAHITLVYPFLPVTRLTAEALSAVAEIFATASAFDGRLASCRRFPGVSYLAPEPVAPFVELVERLVARFPEAPPYGGRFAEVIPHLTIGHAVEAGIFDAIERELLPALPIRFRVDRAVLYEEREGFWRPSRVLGMRGATP